MLVRPHDAATETEWKALLSGRDFAQVIAPGAAREWPVVVPTHYAYDGERTVLAHFARDNPVWAALDEAPRAVLALVADYAYVPTALNAGEEAPPEWGVPTSYYAALQARCDAEVVDAPDELADVLAKLLARMQPEGGHMPVEAGDNPYGRQLRGIRGLRLTIRDVVAKMKYGGNRPLAHRARVAEGLEARGGPMDAEAAERVRRRSGL